MATEIGYFTFGSSPATILLTNPGIPHKLTFIVSMRYGGDTERNRLCIGYGNPDLFPQVYHATITDDVEGSDVDFAEGKVVSHYGVVSSALAKVLEAELTNVDDGEFTITGTPNTNYQITVIAET